MKSKRFKVKKRIKEEAKRIKKKVRKVKPEAAQEAETDKDRWYPSAPSPLVIGSNWKRIL